MASPMIVLYNPKATKPRNRRFPLSILAIAAVLEGREEFAIVDGNLDPQPTEAILALLREHRVELLAVTVMPGPQTVGAVASCREVRRLFPAVPIVWGGYFASNYTQAALNATYVDFAVRGQGEQTFLELLEAIRGERDFRSILGLSYKDSDGTQRHNPERPIKKLDDFPWYPYHRIPAPKYVLPTFLGRRTAAHQASIGCPFRCNFCGVVTFSGSREKLESPARTEQILRHLAHTYGVDAVQFYDNNFFLREDHARELADRIAPLSMEGDTRDCIKFIRQLKQLNPDSEIVVEHYTPVPQRAQMYGGVEGQFKFPGTPDEWATERWQRFATQKDPKTPWLRPETKQLIDNFELVVSSRWPTEQDIRLPRWGRLALKALSCWRYRLGVYSAPMELKWAQRVIALRKPKAESL